MIESCGLEILYKKINIDLNESLPLIKMGYGNGRAQIHLRLFKDEKESKK